MKRYLTAVLLCSLLAPIRAMGRPLRVKAVSAPVRGVASWYGIQHEGKRMANGYPFRRFAFTAASRTIRLGTRIRVFNLKTGGSVDVTVTDRGPFKGNRILDLSEAAARKLGIIQRGLAEIIFTPLPEPIGVAYSD